MSDPLPSSIFPAREAAAPRAHRSERRAPAARRSPDARAWWALGLAAALGLAGLLPRAPGGVDPFALCAWAMLLAAPAGYACGALGVRLLPMGLAPPAVWMIALVQADLVGARDVAATIAPGLLWTGVFLFGLGLGGARTYRPNAGDAVVAALRGAGLMLALGAALAWLAILTGVTTGATGFAAAHPETQTWLCELNPLAPLFDAAGWDWMRANALSYRLAGAEWVARQPWNGALAATVTVVVGCTSALLLPKLGRRGAASARS